MPAGTLSEGALNHHTLRVYNLGATCVRLDSTTANGHWTVTEDGWFQFDHSQDHRPDLPQVTIMVSALDPLGMPVATDVVPGQRAADPPCTSQPSCVCGRAWGSAGCCMWAIVRWLPWRLEPFSRREVMMTCARCRRAHCRQWSWPTTWRRYGRERKP